MTTARLACTFTVRRHLTTAAVTILITALGGSVSTAAGAQATGQVAGIVLDTSNAPVPGALVGVAVAMITEWLLVRAWV